VSSYFTHDTHTRTHTHTYTYTHTHTHTFRQTTHARARARARTHTHTHIQAHTRTPHTSQIAVEKEKKVPRFNMLSLLSLLSLSSLYYYYYYYCIRAGRRANDSDSFCIYPEALVRGAQKPHSRLAVLYAGGKCWGFRV